MKFYISLAAFETIRDKKCKAINTQIVISPDKLPCLPETNPDTDWVEIRPSSHAPRLRVCRDIKTVDYMDVTENSHG